MKKLYREWGSRVQFIEVMVRQAHPGYDVLPYETMGQKMVDARRYKREERLPWQLMADDLRGTTHQVYGGLRNPTFLIDADGRVSFYNLWTYAPNLHLAIQELLQQGGRGVVKGGIDQKRHLSTALIHGWRGIRRGLPQSFFDLETSAPGTSLVLRLGYLLRPLFEPWLIRSRPVPMTVKAGVFALAAALTAGGLLARRRE